MKTPIKNPCLLVVMTTLVWAGALPDALNNNTSKASTIYSAEFGKDAKAWMVVSGSFQVENGVYRSRSLSPEAPLSRAITGDKAWKNYSVDARLKLERWTQPSADFGIIARYQDPGNYYIFLYKRESKKMVIERKLEGKLQVLAEASFNLEPGEWHSFKATLTGEDLEVAIDGTNLVQVSDRNFSQGGAGLLVFWADVQCAQFKIDHANTRPALP